MVETPRPTHDAQGREIDQATGTALVGHEWDGIAELDTPMPRWWLWIFYATVVWALIYTVLFPAWPLVNRATAGVLGWSSHGELQKELAADTKAKGPVRLALSQIPIERLADNAQLLRQAEQGGKAAFRVHCVQCHGSGAAGSPGYPNLNDDDWLWGGDIKSIHDTLVHGIRQPGHATTRTSAMPAFGKDGILTPDQVQDVVSHVRAISGMEKASASSVRGNALFQANCAVCHNADGGGNRLLGAPKLTDRIWLYGGNRASLTQTITYSRAGVMPSWGERLDPVTIKMLAAYVHSLGGGEAFVADPGQPVAADTGVAATPAANSAAPAPATQPSPPAAAPAK